MRNEKLKMRSHAVKFSVSGRHKRRKFDKTIVFALLNVALSEL